MPKQLFIPVFVLALVISACSNGNEEAMKAIGESSNRNSELMKARTDLAYQTLYNRRKKGGYWYKAIIWADKARQVRDLSANTMASLDSLDQQLSTPGIGGMTVKKILAKRGYKFCSLLLAYGRALPALLDTSEFSDNPVLAQQLAKDKVVLTDIVAKRLGMMSDSTGSLTVHPQDWVDSHFNVASSSQAMVLMDKWRQEILAMEYLMTDYCINQTASVSSCGYLGQFPFFSLSNTDYVRAGQSMEICFANGWFDSDNQLAIMIADPCLPVNRGDLTTYSFNARGKPGNYQIPVTIEYDERDGQQKIVQRIIAYTIVD